MRRRVWNNEEIEYLKEKWGQVDTKNICKKLDRTYGAIRHKAKMLKLGPARQADEFLCALELANAIGVERKTVAGYIEKGLKATKKRFGNSKRYNVLIKQKDFWKFAEKNKDLIKFYKFENGDLAGEPSWVQELRTKQIKERCKTKNADKEWTNKEDLILQRMFLQGKTNEEIAIELGRTTVSIASRKTLLLLNVRPRWKNDEIELLKEKVKEGLTDKEIGNMLGRNARSVMGKRLNLNIRKVGRFNEQSGITG